MDIGLKDTRAAVLENPDSLMTKMLHWDSTNHSATDVCQADTKTGFALTSALCIGVMSVVITWQRMRKPEQTTKRNKKEATAESLAYCTAAA